MKKSFTLTLSLNDPRPEVRALTLSVLRSGRVYVKANRGTDGVESLVVRSHQGAATGVTLRPS